MEPKQPTPRSPEFSASKSTPETWSADGLERAPENSYENESTPLGSGGENELPIPVVPMTSAAVQVSTVQDDSASSPSSSNPLSASDDDVIEKEWVDKAKKIISDTKGDPYRREYEVGKLQADYIEKRYGKKLGEAA